MVIKKMRFFDTNLLLTSESEVEEYNNFINDHYADNDFDRIYSDRYIAVSYNGHPMHHHH